MALHVVNTGSIPVRPSHGEVCLLIHPRNVLKFENLLGIVVQLLGLHLVNVGSIPTGPTLDEGRLQPHPGDVLQSTPNVGKRPR